MTGKGNAANSVSQEFASILQMSRHSLLQRLRRCTNVILPSLRNRYLVDNECLAANIVVTARLTTCAVTRDGPEDLPNQRSESEGFDSPCLPFALFVFLVRTLVLL
jgi:hypothetical protein